MNETPDDGSGNGTHAAARRVEAEEALQALEAYYRPRGYRGVQGHLAAKAKLAIQGLIAVLDVLRRPLTWRLRHGPRAQDDSRTPRDQEAG